MNSFYLKFDDSMDRPTSGPYTLSQVQSMWRTGKVTKETLCRLEGALTSYPLELMLDIIEPGCPLSDRTTQQHSTASPDASRPTHEPASPSNPGLFGYFLKGLMERIGASFAGLTMKVLFVAALIAVAAVGFWLLYFIANAK